MTFIKLGDRYLNVQMITDVFVLDQRPERPELQAEVYLSAPMGERIVSSAPFEVSTRFVHVTGDDAHRLIEFLDEHLVGS